MRLPVRGTVATLATIAGLVLLFNFKTPDSLPQRNLGQAIAPAPEATPSSSGDTSATPPPDAAAGPSPSPTASGYRNGKFTGQAVDTRFGTIQVQVVVSGGKISDVKALQLPYDRPRSEEISQYVGPMLHDEVVQAQGAQIDTISGATYTSDAYAQSVQSALDQAH